MQPGQEMTDEELQQAAREAIGDRTQSEVAEALGVSGPTISVALNKKPSRYAGTLKRIIERFAGYRIETTTTTVHRVAGET